MGAEKKERVWYLGYGANMNKNTFEKRRQIKPTESIPCRVPGYKLCFKLFGIPFVEPCFASIEQVKNSTTTTTTTTTTAVTRKAIGNNDNNNDEDCNKNTTSSTITTTDTTVSSRIMATFQDELHGVLHNISHEEFLHIRRTEGGGGHDNVGYTVIEVDVETYDGRKIRAKTLTHLDSHEELFEKWKHRPILPSARYLRLLCTGAREHNLDESYVQYLENLEYYHAATTKKKVGRVLFLIPFIPLMIPFLLIMALFRIMRVTAPRPFYVILDKLMIFAWFLHDSIAQHLFGSGANNYDTKKDDDDGDGDVYVSQFCIANEKKKK